MLKMTLLALFSTSVATVWVGQCGSDGYFPEACAKYVECQAHADAVFDLAPTDTSAYDGDGSCWRDSQEGADACSRFCELETESIGEELEAEGDDLGPCK